MAGEKARYDITASNKKIDDGKRNGEKYKIEASNTKKKVLRRVKQK